MGQRNGKRISLATGRANKMGSPNVTAGRSREFLAVQGLRLTNGAALSRAAVSPAEFFTNIPCPHAALS
jgi:hypothetical protein